MNLINEILLNGTKYALGGKAEFVDTFTKNESQTGSFEGDGESIFTSKNSTTLGKGIYLFRVKVLCDGQEVHKGAFIVGLTGENEFDFSTSGIIAGDSNSAQHYEGEEATPLEIGGIYPFSGQDYFGEEGTALIFLTPMGRAMNLDNYNDGDSSYVLSGWEIDVYKLPFELGGKE